MIRKLITVTALLAAAATTSAPAGVDQTHDFSVKIPIQPVPGASVQRVALPASVLVALQRADLGDLRVFDGAGKALPIARADAIQSHTDGRRVALKAYPILGSPGALTTSGLTLKLDDGKNTVRVAQMDGSSVTGASKNTVLLGTLLDARDVKTPVAGLLLDADLPVSQPVDFTVEASADLSDWEDVAQKVIYRAAVTDRAIASETITLDGADLSGKYLRITWSAASPLLSPVHIRSAILTTIGGTAASSRIMVQATTPPLANAYQVQFALPFGTHPAALRIDPPSGTAVIPVKLLGRADREQPWTALGEGNVYHLTTGGTERSNGAIELPDGGYHEIRIDADPRSGGFPAPPRIEFQFASQQVAVLLSGSPPFTLVAGSPTAANVYLPIQSLVPDGRADRVPFAVMHTDGNAVPVLALLLSGHDGAPRETIILWLVLVLGTLTLGGIAWSLYRTMRRQPPA